MQKLLWTLSIIFFCQSASAQNVGIGTAGPFNKLDVAGNILVSQPNVTTNTAPTAAQTKNLVNGTTLILSAADSTGRLYDPGGPAGNYIDNLNASATIPLNVPANISLTIESIDLETGDSLLVKLNTNPVITVLAFGKGNQAAGNYLINNNNVSVTITFKSNADGLNGAGFALLYKYLYPLAGQTGVTGATGTSMYFNTVNGVFRAGRMSPADVPGNYSAAFGNYSVAGSQNSLAAGGGTTTVAGLFAIGSGAIASGYTALAIGTMNTASGYTATALGTQTTASGYAATTLGTGTTASGDFATAAGYQTTASGDYSTSLGALTTASGDYSLAAGYKVSTNGYKGAFFLGDSDPYNKGVRTVGAANQFVARFNGGYYLLSSNSGGDLGVQVLPGGNSWSAISDVRRKENFAPVAGEDFLKNIAAMNLTSWNYKGQDAKVFRHYGPMAQEFYAAFGKDKYGTIGCDTLINQQDFLGVNLIAIQALEKRTTQLQEENTSLRDELITLKARLEKLEKKEER